MRLIVTDVVVTITAIRTVGLGLGLVGLGIRNRAVVRVSMVRYMASVSKSVTSVSTFCSAESCVQGCSLGLETFFRNVSVS